MCRNDKFKRVLSQNFVAVLVLNLPKTLLILFIDIELKYLYEKIRATSKNY